MSDYDDLKAKAEAEWAKCVEDLASAAYRLQQLAGGAEVERSEVGFACKAGMFHEEIAQQRIRALLAENARLRTVIAQHDLCHDLHGKVGAEDFAKGCAAEIRKIYGRCPWEEENDRLRAELEKARETERERLRVRMMSLVCMAPEMADEFLRRLESEDLIEAQTAAAPQPRR